MAGNLTAMIAAIFSSSAAIPDPYFEYTTLLLPGNGTNGAQNNTFLDGSTNNFTITRNGNTTQGTFSPFSQTGWGNYFDGTGDYLTTPDNVAFTVGSGNWTLEAWVYPTASPNQPIIVGQWSGGSDGSICMILSNDGNRYLRGLVYSGGTVDRISGSSLQLNAWNHCAFVREGTFLNLYLNGSRVDNYSFGSGSIQDSSLVMSIGAGSGGIVPFQGYISNCRFLKGTAQYTGATYTVPTAPLTAITNTVLLTCQSNRFKDNSTNNFTITVNGDTRVVAFSPFNPTASWSAATNGGSGYFDGSGDYLQIPTNTAFNLGTGAFCVEFWVYITSLAEQPSFINNNSTNIFYETSGLNRGLCLYASAAAQLTSSTTALPLNAWNHVVICRNTTGTLSSFANGNRLATAASNTSTVDFSNAIINRYFPSVAGHLFGYTSDLRMVKGSTPYDPTLTTCTVPTAPLTAITNTSLLLNFTNAGIYDATSKNDLETVGNAQISTTQSKWGGSSMYFDGSGDYLVVGNMATNPILALLAGDFTIEWWYYPLNTSTHGILTNLNDSDGTGSLWILTNGVFSGGSKVQFGYNTGSSGNILFGTGTFTINNWYHVAVCRSGINLRCFINGTQEGSTSTALGSGSITAYNRNLTIGATLSNVSYTAYNLNGYIQDLRITKFARYTANFTAPTAAFPTL